MNGKMWFDDDGSLHITIAEHSDKRDQLYRERAHLVAFLASRYPARIGRTDPAEPDWYVVVIDTPEGQLSWHVSPDDIDLFKHVIPSDRDTWDGHDTGEKLRRLRLLTAGSRHSNGAWDSLPEQDGAAVNYSQLGYSGRPMTDLLHLRNMLRGLRHASGGTCMRAPVSDCAACTRWAADVIAKSVRPELDRRDGAS